MFLITFLLTVLLSISSALAVVCEPTISLKAESGIALKEGHQKNISTTGVYLEMDRYCPDQEVKVTVLIRGQSAILGEHVLGDEINTVIIPAGQIAGYLSFSIIGDNEWNEDRLFSVQAINPTLGHIDISTVDFTITNDDPQIQIVMAKQVKEPRKGFLDVAVKVQLSMPAEQRITGEVEFTEQSAVRGEDFEAPFNYGFEILPGETEFVFLPNTLIIKLDDQKESTESLRLFLNEIKNATPSNQSALLLIKENPNYTIKFSSKIIAIAESRVAMTSQYSFETDMTEEASDGHMLSDIVIPVYKHTVTEMPGPVKASAGKVRVSINVTDDNFSYLRLELVESPFEIYPYMTQKLYMFASSFMKLHEKEFVTIQRPTSSLPYPTFELLKITKGAEGKWSLKYKNSLSEDGVEVLREETLISVAEQE